LFYDHERVIARDYVGRAAYAFYWAPFTEPSNSDLALARVPVPKFSTAILFGNGAQLSQIGIHVKHNAVRQQLLHARNRLKDRGKTR
jgi:hypothetical protein